MKSLDGSGLLDVERLAGGDLSNAVDQHDPSDTFAARERMRNGAAEFAGSEDASGRHDPVRVL
jgi:hypothetical protein